MDRNASLLKAHIAEAPDAVECAFAAFGDTFLRFVPCCAEEPSLARGIPTPPARVGDGLGLLSLEQQILISTATGVSISAIRLAAQTA